MEIVTGRERRRRWSEEDKLKILQEAATSGLSVADVARRYDVVPQQIYIQGQSRCGCAWHPAAFSAGRRH
jgi:transposase-like protein